MGFLIGLQVSGQIQVVDTIYIWKITSDLKQSDPRHPDEYIKPQKTEQFPQTQHIHRPA